MLSHSEAIKNLTTSEDSRLTCYMYVDMTKIILELGVEKKVLSQEKGAAPR